MSKDKSVASDGKGDAAAVKLIDARIKELGDWRAAVAAGAAAHRLHLAQCGICDAESPGCRAAGLRPPAGDGRAGVGGGWQPVLPGGDGIIVGEQPAALSWH